MKKFIAICLALAVLAVCTACSMGTIRVEFPGEEAYSIFTAITGGNGGGSQGGSSQVPSQQTPAVTETQQQTEITTAPSQTPASDSTTAAQQETPSNSGSSETPASTPAPTGAPSSKSEIIAYYVKAYNKIGTDGGKITRTYDYTSNYNGILNINNNNTLKSLANTLMDKFMVENTDPLDTAFADLPPKGVSSLSIPDSAISDAKITDNGSTYTVVLKSTGTDDNQEADLQPGTGSAGLIGPLLRTEDVTDAAKGFITFDGLHAYYATASVTATIDKTTGHITALEYSTPCILHFDQVTAVVIKVQNCDIGLLFQQKYSIAY